MNLDFISKRKFAKAIQRLVCLIPNRLYSRAVTKEKHVAVVLEGTGARVVDNAFLKCLVENADIPTVWIFNTSQNPNFFNTNHFWLNGKGGRRDKTIRVRNRDNSITFG